MPARVMFSPVAIVAVVSVVLASSVLGVPFEFSLNNITDTPGCHSNADCTGDKVCSEWKCSDPCHPNICGPETFCYVANHNPICCGKRHIVRQAIGLGAKTNQLHYATTERTIPEPFRPRQKRFHLNVIAKMNWYQAWEYCRSTNMDLAVLEDQQDYDNLHRMLKDIKITADFWISGSDLGEAHRFFWMTTGTAVSYTNWAPGEPNHAIVDGEVEHCIEMSWGVDYKMNDDRCSTPKYHVCQH